MWMRWNDATHIFEQSFNDGASWAVLPLNASVINEGAVNIARLPANLAVKDANNNFTVGQTVTGGIGVTAGGIVVTGNSSITGALVVTGLISANSVGTHVFTGSGTGGAGLRVQNPTAAPNTAGVIILGNDANPNIFQILAYSSATAPGGYIQPNGIVFYNGGAGGLSVWTSDAAGTLRFYTGVGATERMRIDAAGLICLGTQASIFGGLLCLFADIPSRPGIVLQNASASNSGNLQLYLNSAGVVAGNIAHSSATTIFYGSSSDARLKKDLGRVADSNALREVIVHEFEWKEDKIKDRGIFAQEAHHLFPKAILKGTDELTEKGQLKMPWMTDYAKFVPDLIAGWQEHDKRISELEAKLNA